MGATAAETSNRATPILDRLAPLPKAESPRSESGFMIAAWIVLGAAILTMLVFWRPPFLQSLRRVSLASFTQSLPDQLTASSIVILALSLALVGFAIVMIHELGHVLGGIWAGYRFDSMRVGPIQLDRRLRISRYRGPGAWIRGTVSMIPVKTDKLILRAIVMVFAGPAANVFSGYAAAAAPVPAGLHIRRIHLQFNRGGSGRARLSVSRPERRFRWSSNLDAVRRSRAGRAWVALMRLGAELRDGVPPESMSVDFLAMATRVRDDSPETIAAHAFAYMAAFHQHQDAERGPSARDLPEAFELRDARFAQCALERCRRVSGEKAKAHRSGRAMAG